VKIGLPNFPNSWGNIWTNFLYNTKLKKKVPWAAKNSSLFLWLYIAKKRKKIKIKSAKIQCFLRFSIARIRILKKEKLICIHHSSSAPHSPPPPPLQFCDVYNDSQHNNIQG